MKKLFAFLLISFYSISSCDVIENSLNLTYKDINLSKNENQLSNDEIISGLKEALIVGITNSVNLTSVKDGFLKNNSIRLPFPEDAIKVKQKAIDIGLKNKVDEFETVLNRAAEEATKEAFPIFKNAILNMSIEDGLSILKGGDGAATLFLKKNTQNALIRAFRPKVENAITKVNLTKYWNPIIKKYNSAMIFTGGQKLDPDLAGYVTQKAIAGLFFMVEKEENKIRKEPLARVSDILKKVFGSIN